MRKSIYLLFALLLCCQLGANEKRVQPPGYQKKLLLITGCARSGTTYIVEVLRECGLDIVHEAFGKDGSSSWAMCVESDHLGWGDSRNGVYFEHFWHQVRHPLKAISSIYHTEPQQTWDYISWEIPEMHPDDSRVVKCAKFWYYWNLIAEKNADWTYQLEKIPTHFAEMSSRLGRPLDKKKLKLISKKSNHRGKYKQKYTWSSLKKQLPPDLFMKIKKLAKRYGYKVKGVKLTPDEKREMEEFQKRNHIKR